MNIITVLSECTAVQSILFKFVRARAWNTTNGWDKFFQRRDRFQIMSSSGISHLLNWSLMVIWSGIRIENVENSRRRRPRKKIGFAVLFHLWNRSNSRPNTCFLVPELLQGSAPDWPYSRKITCFVSYSTSFPKHPPPPPHLRTEQPRSKESSGIVSYD